MLSEIMLKRLSQYTLNRTVIFLEDLGLGEKRIAEMLAPVSIRRLTLCFFDSKYNPGLPCFYSGHRNLCGRPRDLSLGGRLWPWFPWEPGTECLPVFSTINGAGSQR
jgi:hypothetical protein